MRQTFIATVYDDKGQPILREENREPFSFERHTPERAFLTARNFEWPAGTLIVVTRPSAKVPGTQIQAPPKVVWARRFDGTDWVSVELQKRPAPAAPATTPPESPSGS